MRMEVIGWHELLECYIKLFYAKKDVLVVFQDDIDSRAEFDALMADLELEGFAPPHQFRGAGYLIIEMDEWMGRKLINNHRKGSIRIELFSDGICVHETGEDG